jgi:ribosomal protein S12 methylthiotransferase accessory factor YcaO
MYVDLTRPEIDIPVVRVIIPGMELYSVDTGRMGKRLL